MESLSEQHSGEAHLAPQNGLDALVGEVAAASAMGWLPQRPTRSDPHQQLMSTTAQIECTGINLEPYTIIPSSRLKPLDHDHTGDTVGHSPFDHYLLVVAGTIERVVAVAGAIP